MIIQRLTRDLAIGAYVSFTFSLEEGTDGLVDVVVIIRADPHRDVGSIAVLVCYRTCIQN